MGVCCEQRIIINLIPCSCGPKNKVKQIIRIYSETDSLVSVSCLHEYKWPLQPACNGTHFISLALLLLHLNREPGGEPVSFLSTRLVYTFRASE